MFGCSTHRIAAIVMIVTAAAWSACGLGAGSAPKPPSRALADGETIGKVERSMSGATAGGEVHTLLSVACQKSTLVIRTSVETITADADCAKAPIQASLERVLGLPAVILRAGDSLRITNPTGTNIDVPASNIMVTERNVTP